MRKLIACCLIAGAAWAEPLPNNWTLPDCAQQSDDLITISPTNCSFSTFARQRIPGPFKAGELLRFSADVELVNIQDDQGNLELRPFDLNLHPRNVCLALAQIDNLGRTLCAPASQRLLGTQLTHLSMETVIQQDVAEIELRLLATLVTGNAVFKNIQLEQLPATPLQPLPKAEVLKNKNGACYWAVDDEPQPLAMYFGNNQFNRDDSILSEMEKAVGAGVPVLSFNLHLPNFVSNDEILKVIDRFMKPFPNAYFIPRIWVGPNPDWQKSFPEEMMKYADGQIGSYASPASERWKSSTDQNLRELVNLIRRSPYARQCIGFKLTYYQTGEWIFWDPHRAAGFDEPTRSAFANWLQQKYGQDFSDVTVPTEAERNLAADGLLRDPATQQRVIDFSLFYNTINADTISRFAQTIKDASGGNSLTAAFYGYLFELAWHEKCLQQGGHLGLEKLYRSPSVDIISAPYSYNPIGRGFGLPVDQHGPFDGANEFNKLVMIEEDTFTHLAEEVPEVVKGYAPGYASRTTTMEETLAVLRRNLGVAVAHNQILLWQNLFSEGRFNHQKIWDMYKPYLAWMKERTLTAQKYAPQVAVLADPSAVTLLKTDAYEMTERWLYQPRFFLNRVDTSVGYYHTSELGLLPDSVRCLVLLTPWSITAEQEDILKDRFMQNGRTIIFCGTTSLGNITLSPIEGPLMPKSKLADGTVFGARQFGHQDANPVAHIYAVKDRKARVFAHYTENNEPSCAVKKISDWTAVFLGSSGLPAKQWRKLFKEASCHLYLKDSDFSEDFNHPDFIQTNGNFLMLQSSPGGPKEIQLPEQASRIFQFDQKTPELIKQDSRTVRIPLQPGVPTFICTE